MSLQDSADKAAAAASEDMSKDQERKSEQKKNLSTAWRVAPVVAQAADGLMTYKNLKSGGEEYNPALKGLAKKSPEALLAGKVALGLGTSALANHIHKKYGDRKGGKLLAKVIAGGGALTGGYGAAVSFKNRNGRDVKGKR